MPHDLIGWIHTIAAIIALITGTLILIGPKGTPRHMKTGKVYVISMFIVCSTSFMIFRVHGTFGILHIFACISTITLVLGMLPMYIKDYKNPIVIHLAWMYWSVIGLYCAFSAELFTRLPILLQIENTYGIFYGLVGLSTGFVGFLGSRYFKRNKPLWEERFSSQP